MKNKAFNHQLKNNKKGQIFLVCTVIIIIYMLSFINILYELNVSQIDRSSEIEEFQNAYENLRTETNAYLLGLLANYTQPGTIITTNAIGAQYLQTWLDFYEEQMLSKGFFAVLDVEEIALPATPIELIRANGYASIRANIDIYMECNYLTIDTEMQCYFRYEISYTNYPTYSIITFFYQTNLETVYIGYATVLVNSLSTINYYNGQYRYNAPLVATNVIQATTTATQIIVTRTI